MTQSNDEFEKEKKAANKSSLEGMERLRKDERDRQQQADLEAAQMIQRQKWAKTMDELRNKHKVKTKDGESTLHEEVQQLADHMITSEQSSINDWRSNMMSLLNVLTKLNKAVNVSSQQVGGEALDLMKNTTRPIPYVRGLFHPQEFIYEAAKSAVLNRVKGDGDFNLPLLEHKVSFKDGKVQVADLTRADGIPFNKENEANKAFKTFVSLWLQEHDYVYDTQAKTYVHYANGTKLDEDVFNELNGKNKPTNFAKFLEHHATLKYQEQNDERVQSTPTPP
ncbi:hypothetical protein OQJ18_04880 [Fluoribacter dumoffii]|uniref:Membrane-associated HD superfamily hydrolase n=1 Tax=Fluoribacter dumoffii TaxID=463 RepID=A0A377G9B8_9GAMM|nr:hypothetical protein [Fluoribacter dumoffii]KTC90233.1 hypothetical protein Ldum_1301 [Fluoribacter dumoffii NY 23]MCW8385551.1 hypothetical protein [Fluoribacter dumoffii]MCW8418579.1 hypothetical protein [Fluoribacter dumoffii]MCW8453579.1 hypothetical protein [Fluoribacter dumoffii]MCW8459203.1 hypothetical protein [Fluoribacter dumoffii]